MNYIIIFLLSMIIGVLLFIAWVFVGIYHSVRHIEDCYIDVNLDTLLREEEDTK